MLEKICYFYGLLRYYILTEAGTWLGKYPTYIQRHFIDTIVWVYISAHKIVGTEVLTHEAYKLM